MAQSQTYIAPEAALGALRSFFEHRLDAFREARARRKAYRTTYSELSRLSDRELQDLGLHRSMIKRLAKVASYDC